MDLPSFGRLFRELITTRYDLDKTALDNIVQIGLKATDSEDFKQRLVDAYNPGPLFGHSLTDLFISAIEESQPRPQP